jgi:hypothetical protein
LVQGRYQRIPFELPDKEGQPQAAHPNRHQQIEPMEIEVRWMKGRSHRPEHIDPAHNQNHAGYNGQQAGSPLDVAR